MAAVQFINSISCHRSVAAIEEDRVRAEQYFEKHGWDTQDKRSSMAEALKLAVVYKHYEYTQHILENYIHEAILSADCCPVIFLAIMRDADDILELLCEQARKARLRMNSLPYIDARGCSSFGEGKTALHLALELGKLGAVRILLRYGADPYVEDVFCHNVLERGLEVLINLFEGDHFQPLNFWDSLSTIDRRKFRYRVICGLIEVSDVMTTLKKSSVAFVKYSIAQCFRTFPREEHDALIQLTSAFEKILSPPSLVRACRCVIRQHLGYQFLPFGVRHLGLPRRLSCFVSLNITDTSQIESD